MGTPDATATRRTWIVQLYFSLAALVGLGFLIVGVTTALFGAKDLAFPELGLQSYSYESNLRRDPQGVVVATDGEREAARQRAVDDARRQGLDGLVNGAILVVVGAPTLVWHLRRGRLGPGRGTAGPAGTGSDRSGAEPSAAGPPSG